MLVLDAAQVRAAFPVADAVRVMRETMAAHAAGQVHQPPRMLVRPPALDGLAMLKPAQVGEAFGFKALTMFDGNRERGLETIQAFVALLDPETGVLRAILEGGVVTEIRTAAVSAVATEVLARADAGDLALVGAGVQARSHLLALAQVRDLRRVRVWNRTPERATEFTSWAAEHGFEVEACPSVRAAVTGADLVCTLTASPEPLVEAGWLAAGTHLNAVGAYTARTRELAAGVLGRAGVIAVDSREAAAADAGDLLLAQADGALPESFRPVELGELLTGVATGRTDGDQLTVFESLGLAIQDLAAAAFIVDRARADGSGADLPDL